MKLRSISCACPSGCSSSSSLELQWIGSLVVVVTLTLALAAARSSHHKWPRRLYKPADCSLRLKWPIESIRRAGANLFSENGVGENLSLSLPLSVALLSRLSASEQASERTGESRRLPGQNLEISPRARHWSVKRRRRRRRVECRRIVAPRGTSTRRPNKCSSLSSKEEKEEEQEEEEDKSEVRERESSSILALDNTAARCFELIEMISACGRHGHLCVRVIARPIQQSPA